MTSRTWRFIGGLAVVAVLVTVAAWIGLPSQVEESGVTAAFVLIAFGSGLIPLRLHRAGGTQGFHFEGAVLVGALLVLPVGIVPPLMVAAAAFTHLLRRPLDARKVVFNPSKTALEMSAGAFVFWAIAPAAPDVTSARTLVAVLAASAAYEVVSAVVMAELFRTISGTPRLESIRDASRMARVTFVGNTTFGIIFGVVATVSSAFVVLAGFALLGLYLGYRGYASALEGQRRSHALRELSHALLDQPSSGSGLEDVLVRLVGVFGGSAAELVLEGPVTEPRRWTVDASGPVAELPDASDRIVAPVVRRSAPIGMLTVWGRRGLEAWDEGDEGLLEAVAAEIAVWLDNADLFHLLERERARLEAESTKLADIIGAATDGIALVRADGIVDAWNPGMARITGTPVDDAVRRPWDQVLRLRTDDNRELTGEADHAITRALAGQVWTDALQLQALRRDGSWRRVACTSSVVRDTEGDVEGVVLVVRDVTAERELESLKSEFIATVSHELRTPLTPLTGFLGTLRSQGQLLDDDQRHTIHDAMGKQLARLEALIGDLLAVAELDHGDFDVDVRPVDLAEAVQAAVLTESPEDRDRVTVRGDDVRALGDPLALVRVLRSLVSNALKHTSGPVEVDIELVDSLATVAVRDHGPGIASWEQQRIFRRFERLGNHLTRTQGPGLGLTIARSLARRMSGDVTVTSELGVGSTFVLSLPSARPRVVGGHARVLPLDDQTA